MPPGRPYLWRYGHCFIAPFTSPIASDNGTTRTVSDLSATGPQRFYHVEITKP